MHCWIYWRWDATKSATASLLPARHRWQGALHLYAALSHPQLKTKQPNQSFDPPAAGWAWMASLPPPVCTAQRPQSQNAWPPGTACPPGLQPQRLP